MVATIGVIISIGILWRIWLADLEMKHPARITISVIASLIISLLSLVFFSDTGL